MITGKYFRLIFLLGLVVLLTGTQASAGNLYLLGGIVNGNGVSEAADWDNQDSSGTTQTMLQSGGGWDQDTICPPGACLNVTSGVSTPGGSASTVSTAAFVTNTDNEYVFPSLFGQLVSYTDADIAGEGIISEAEAHVEAVHALVVLEDTQVLLGGKCNSTASGSVVEEAFGYVVVLDENENIVAVGGDVCPPSGGPCGSPFMQAFLMEAGKVYWLYGVTRADVSTQSSASDAVTLSYVVIALQTPDDVVTE